jgi:ubiquinone/menaquinone biosynthesis C-methylase UbiE
LRSKIENKIVVDIGCGAGDDLLLYQKMGAKKVIGIEPALKMLDQKNLIIKLREILKYYLENLRIFLLPMKALIL